MHEDNNINQEDISQQDDSQQDPSEESIAEKQKDSRFKDGQLLKFVKVRFPGNARSFSFFIGNRKFIYGQKVVAMSDRGMAVGYINSFPYELAFSEELSPVRSISKVATDKDLAEQRDHYKQQKEIETVCNDLIAKHNLDMNLTHVEFTQFGKKAVFYFTAPARVDFRGLVKDLVNELKIRIELRQISVRDRAASVGGIGPCGRQLCCSSFLGKYGNVSVKMAKNQDLTLNFSKLNGVCGQLKCCLQYEDDVYAHKRGKLPQVGDVIKTKDEEIGEVTSLNILLETFDMVTTKGVRRRYSVEYFVELADTKLMPHQFEHITDETSSITGLEEHKEKLAKQFERDIEKIINSSVGYANEVFKDLFGAETLEISAGE